MNQRSQKMTDIFLLISKHCAVIRIRTQDRSLHQDYHLNFLQEKCIRTKRNINEWQLIKVDPL